MRSVSKLPHPLTRAAIFWILFATWPGLRLAGHIWHHPGWLSPLEDFGAALMAASVLLGKYLFQNTQRDVCNRISCVEEKVQGYDEAWDLLAPYSDIGG